eukprot:4576150-Lingulodinium_polyedra.AAC.1
MAGSVGVTLANFSDIVTSTFARGERPDKPCSAMGHPNTLSALGDKPCTGGDRRTHRRPATSALHACPR